jgi:site-specific recombinase XerD
VSTGDLRRALGLLAEIPARAGCPGVTLHMLRHRFATRLVADGQHLFLVQELMRHSSSATTKGYVQVDPAQMADAVASLPRAA